jgi:hypothetical protein
MILAKSLTMQRLIRTIALISLTLWLTVVWMPPAWAEGVDQAKIDNSTQLWETSAHALNDINCSSCHQAAETKAFVAQPGVERGINLSRDRLTVPRIRLL